MTQTTQLGTRGGWCFGLVLGALTLLGLTMQLGTTPAQAQTGDVATVEVRFWAFSSNPQFFAYHTTNHHGDEIFMVGQAGSSDPVYQEAATDSRSPRDILVSREMRDAYGWNSGGNASGLTSPSGFYTLNVRESGPVLSVTVQQGINAHPLGAIQRLGDGGGRDLADYEVKEVIWSDTETHVVVVIHQQMEGEWPIAVDTVHAFATPGPAPAGPQ